MKDGPRARIASLSEETLREAATLLRSGEVVGVPTETVYGLGGLISSEEALAKIFSVKERPRFDPLIVHIAETKQKTLQWLSDRKWINLDSIEIADRPMLEKLMNAFWPGPLTLVLPKHARVPELATSGLPSVAIRMPAHPAFQRLLAEVDEGIAAPSANRFGRISPVRAQDVASELGDRIRLIIDGGIAEVGVESTVVEYAGKETLRLLRPGGLAREKIEALLGRPLIAANENQRATNLLSPGMLDSHYAPEKQSLRLARPVLALSKPELDRVVEELYRLQPSLAHLSLLCPHGSALEASKRIEAAASARDPKAPLKLSSIELSPKGDDVEAARSLFSALRAFDQSESTLLLIEPVERHHGLFLAIADRLKKASKLLELT